MAEEEKNKPRKWIVRRGRMNPDARLKDTTIPDKEERVKLMFHDSPKRRDDFRIKLKYDSLRQSEFFRAMVSGYLDDDPDLMKYVEKYKEEMKIHNVQKRNKSKLLRKRARQEKNNFALSEDDLDSIFDIIAEENPDL
tara:strand:- start:418 stop:831 length:414 start_codon:yes stop_codon:yes gene_type:complete